MAAAILHAARKSLEAGDPGAAPFADTAGTAPSPGAVGAEFAAGEVAGGAAAGSGPAALQPVTDVRRPVQDIRTITGLTIDARRMKAR
ncbi:hypothetical protein Acsp01_74540 [Actinoplanes sp. NBRC 101535]|nr:hypothetical protein Acsp01_74540 [Actinoplanes sp. NBRC 101535]